MKGQKGYVFTDVHSDTTQRGLAARLRRWYELHRQRHQLAQLGEAALKDMGLSRADTYLESERPFWDDPLRK